MNKDNCKGCPLMPINSCYPYSNKCPCIKCLVKVTCMDVCEEFDIFSMFVSKETIKNKN